MEGESSPRNEVATITEHAPARPDDVLAALDIGADRYLAENQKTNTKRSYDGDWAAWQQYCAQLGIPATSNTRGALVGFVVWLQNKPPSPRDLAHDPAAQPRPQAPSTIDRRLAGVVVKLSELGAEPLRDTKKKAREALDTYRRQLTEAAITLGRGRAPAAKIDHLRLIAEKTPPTLAGRRDLALILVGFRFASRSSEIANLLLSDIEDAGEKGIVITVRFGKTGGRRVPIPRGQRKDICPVTAWRAWRHEALYDHGPALAQIAKNDKLRLDETGVPLPLGPKGVREVIDRAAKRAGVELHLTGHSLRSGLATEARRSGHDSKTISGITGHSANSAVMASYFREVDEWVEAPDNIL